MIYAIENLNKITMQFRGNVKCQQKQIQKSINTYQFWCLLYLIDNSQEKKKMEDLLKELVRWILLATAFWANDTLEPLRILHFIVNIYDSYFLIAFTEFITNTNTYNLNAGITASYCLPLLLFPWYWHPFTLNVVSAFGEIYSQS